MLSLNTFMNCTSVANTKNKITWQHKYLIWKQAISEFTIYKNKIQKKQLKIKNIKPAPQSFRGERGAYQLLLYAPSLFSPVPFAKTDVLHLKGTILRRLRSSSPMPVLSFLWGFEGPSSFSLLLWGSTTAEGPGISLPGVRHLERKDCGRPLSQQLIHEVILGPGCSGGPSKRTLPSLRIFATFNIINVSNFQQSNHLFESFTEIEVYIQLITIIQISTYIISFWGCPISFFFFLILACCGYTLPSRPIFSKTNLNPAHTNNR